MLQYRPCFLFCFLYPVVPFPEQVIGSEQPTFAVSSDMYAVNHPQQNENSYDYLNDHNYAIRTCNPPWTPNKGCTGTVFKAPPGIFNSKKFKIGNLGNIANNFELFKILNMKKMIEINEQNISVANKFFEQHIKLIGGYYWDYTKKLLNLLKYTSYKVSNILKNIYIYRDDKKILENPEKYCDSCQLNNYTNHINSLISLLFLEIMKDLDMFFLEELADPSNYNGKCLTADIEEKINNKKDFDYVKSFNLYGKVMMKKVELIKEVETPHIKVAPFETEDITILHDEITQLTKKFVEAYINQVVNYKKVIQTTFLNCIKEFEYILFMNKNIEKPTNESTENMDAGDYPEDFNELLDYITTDEHLELPKDFIEDMTTEEYAENMAVDEDTEVSNILIRNMTISCLQVSQN